MTAKTEDRSAGTTQRPGYKEAAERIVAFIRAAGLRPGDRLPIERSLGAQLGIGRSTLREALKVLTGAGILYTRQGSGIYLAREPHPFATAVIDLAMPVDPEHIGSLFEFRSTLEIQTARLAAERSTPRDLQALQEAVAVTRQGADAGEVDRFGEGDYAFHQGIATATGNPFLTSAVRTVLRLQDWAIEMILSGPPNSLRVAAEEHAAVFAAISRGQADAAGAAMQAHLRTAATAYQREARRRVIGAAPSPVFAAAGAVGGGVGGGGAERMERA